MNGFIGDLRLGFRHLRRAPGFTLAAVATLALGIGANSAIFGVLNAVLIRALPYPGSDRLVMVEGRNAAGGNGSLSPRDFLHYRRANHSFEGLAAYRTWRLNLRAGSGTELVSGAFVTGDFFPIVGLAPRLGRFPGGDGAAARNDEAAISDRLWRTAFGGRPDILGQVVAVDGAPRVVVGVLPSGFALPAGTDVWLPSPYAVPPHPLDPGHDPSQLVGSHYFEVLGRLRPGVTLSAVSAEANRLFASGDSTQDADRAVGVTLETLRESEVGNTRPALLILAGAAGFLLLIACANLANLVLARAASRRQEWVIRAALGASRVRLVRGQVVESLLLSVLGGVAGLAVAVQGVAALRSLAPWSIRQLIQPRPDLAVLSFTLLVSVLTGLLFGAGAALLGGRADLAAGLREAARSATPGGSRDRVRSLLVVAEVALAFTLAIGAGLLVKAFVRIRAVPSGLDSRGVLTMSLSLPRTAYRSGAARTGFVDRLRSEIAPLPGVLEVSAVSRLALNPGRSTRSIEVEGSVQRNGEEVEPDYLVAAPDYFRSMGIRLVGGRGFTARDGPHAPPVAVVSRRLAELLWPGGSALGRRLKVGDDTAWRTVVGVASDVRQHRLEEPPAPTLYLPYAEDPWPFFTLVVQSRGDPAALAGPAEAAIHRLDPDLAVAAVRAMDVVIGDSLVARRFSLFLVGLFALLAMVLATVGVYGVMAYSVTQRVRELGIRMALGAQPADLHRLVLGYGLRLALAGIGIGLVGALWLAPLLGSLLYGVRPVDPSTFATVALGVLGVALLAALLPARRATRVDPMTVLRAE